MIPENYSDDEGEAADFEFAAMPSLCHAVHGVERKLIGTLDGVEAVRQAVSFILGTERYDHAIYGWEYGVELKDLIGRDKNFVMSEIKERIKEALLQDDRIEGVDNFTIEESGRRGLLVRFRVASTEGGFEAEKEVGY